MNKIFAITIIILFFLGFVTIAYSLKAVTDEFEKSDNMVYDFCKSKDVAWGIGGVHYCSGKPYVCSKQNCTWVSIHTEG